MRTYIATIGTGETKHVTQSLQQYVKVVYPDLIFRFEHTHIFVEGEIEKDKAEEIFNKLELTNARLYAGVSGHNYKYETGTILKN